MSPFDIITVVCFIGLVVAYFQFTPRDDYRTLGQLILSGIVFAVANQVGNAGFVLLASVLILAGVGYALLVIRG
jgi:uncharacterized membrane protein